jgi:HSP20 family protein
MKWFADDYPTDEVEKDMKISKRSIHQFEDYRMHTDLGWRPSMDLYETRREIVVLVELAGMRKEDIEVTVRRERVQLRGNRLRPSEDAVARIHHMEINFGPYDQVFTLPKPVDPRGAVSSYSDGFLVIRLPKERTKEISNG